MSGCKVADGFGTMLVKTAVILSVQLYILFSVYYDQDDSQLFL
jgi:hypothetical protein